MINPKHLNLSLEYILRSYYKTPQSKRRSQLLILAQLNGVHPEALLELIEQYSEYEEKVKGSPLEATPVPEFPKGPALQPVIVYSDHQDPDIKYDLDAPITPHSQRKDIDMGTDRLPKKALTPSGIVLTDPILIGIFKGAQNGISVADLHTKYDQPAKRIYRLLSKWGISKSSLNQATTQKTGMSEQTKKKNDVPQQIESQQPVDTDAQALSSESQQLIVELCREEILKCNQNIKFLEEQIDQLKGRRLRYETVLDSLT